MTGRDQGGAGRGRRRMSAEHAAVRGSAMLHRLADAAARAFGEFAYVLYDPGVEHAVSDDYYNAHVLDYSEARHQRAGFFPFEEAMLREFFPPPPARILLPGAGTGRELLVLLERGYDVDSLEPVPGMAAAANETLAGRATVRTMTLQQYLEDAPQTFDGVFTGWGMWTHMTAYADRIDAMRRLRAICSGPLLLSFVRHDELNYSFDGKEPSSAPLHPAGAGAVQRVMRGFVRQRLFGRPPLERGLALHGGMFKHIFTEPELQEEAAETGWRVAYYCRDATQYGHAVLLPVP